MKTNMLIRARRHFAHDLAPDSVARANQRKWVRSIRRLGTKWLLHPANNTVRKDASQ